MSAAEKKILHTFQDKTFIEVADKGEFRTLCFRDSVVQSKILRKEPHRLILRYTHYMMASSLLAHPKPSKVLLIGVGAGAMLHFFNHYFPATEVDAVDYSEHIIKIARGFFALPENQQIRIHCDDGFRFLSNAGGKDLYDLIMLDAFNDKGMAKNIYSNEFLRLARSKLTANGIINCNLWSGNTKAFNRVKKAIRNNTEYSVFIPVRKRENIVSLLFQTPVPWKKMCPQLSHLKELGWKYGVDFAEVSIAAKKNNLKLGERVQLWLN